MNVIWFIGLLVLVMSACMTAGRVATMNKSNYLFIFEGILLFLSYAITMVLWTSFALK